MSAAKKSKPSAQIRESEKKWGKPLLDAGFTIIPSTLIEYQHRLGLEPLDVCVLLQIMKHWWDADDPPFPSRQSIADCIGRDKSTIQRSLSKMRDLGLIEIKHRHHSHKGQTSSAYCFDGLIAKATGIAQQKNEAATRRKGQHSASRKAPPKTKPKFKVVNKDR